VAQALDALAADGGDAAAFAAEARKLLDALDFDGLLALARAARRTEQGERETE
jgi:hypothetical protein